MVIIKNHSNVTPVKNQTIQQKNTMNFTSKIPENKIGELVEKSEDVTFRQLAQALKDIGNDIRTKVSVLIKK